LEAEQAVRYVHGGCLVGLLLFLQTLACDPLLLLLPLAAAAAAT
jgi:hypothetical protein